jgi:hypothetical protein
MVHTTHSTSDAFSSTTRSNGTIHQAQPDAHHHLWIVTGPAGCGKSTVGEFIAETMNLPFIEGDMVRPSPLPLPQQTPSDPAPNSITPLPTSTRCPATSP